MPAAARLACQARPRAPLQRTTFIKSNRRRPWPPHAAAGGQPADDPYKELGLSPGADSAAVERAYRTKKRAAELAGDQAALKRIENAQNSLFMASLSSRLAGSGPVEKSVRHADRTELAPWRPRILAAPDQILKFAAAVYAAILGYNFLLMSSPDGVVSAAMAGVVFNCWKRYHFFPVDSGELQKRIDGGWRNLFRSALLTALATLAGVLLFWSIPDFLSEQLRVTLPFAFYENQAALTTFGSLLCNFLTVWWLR